MKKIIWLVLSLAVEVEVGEHVWQRAVEAVGLDVDVSAERRFLVDDGFDSQRPVIVQDADAGHVDLEVHIEETVDRAVAEGRDIEDAGLADDTIIFYYSDHGGILPRAKRYIYDTGNHVPLIARLAQSRAAAGDAKGAGVELRRGLAVFRAGQETTPDIFQARALRPLAVAAQK